MNAGWVFDLEKPSQLWEIINIFQYRLQMEGEIQFQYTIFYWDGVVIYNQVGLWNFNPHYP